MTSRQLKEGSIITFPEIPVWAKTKMKSIHKSPCEMKSIEAAECPLERTPECHSDHTDGWKH